MADTVFTKVDYTLGALMEAIQLGTIGLPDIQRPFVWKNIKVRNLFDSMYRGYPVGYLLFWENADVNGSRAIGADGKQKVPQQLIVDGQQRLTSLYAVIKGVPVYRENYKTETIDIAFNPLTERLEVADAAVRQDRAFLPNISVLWRPDADLFDLVDEYLKGLESVQEVTDDDRRRVRRAIQRLQNLLSFPFTALTLSAGIDEEQVSEVFVRINSEGKTLNQADFILTLMSVFWDEGRAQLEEFCKEARQPTAGQASSFNHFIEPMPDQLLRVSVGLGFRRGRLRSVYSVLRGKDLESDQFSPERRDAQFAILKDAQARTLNIENWHAFFRAVHRAGFRSWRMISSPNSLMYVYICFLMGRTDYRVDRGRLERLTAQWFFMAALTGRYTNSPESTIEADLARFRGVTDPDGFAEVLETICVATLTPDYWSITLPTDLATSAARSPSLFAYFAALNILEARALFSDRKVSDLMDPSTLSKRSPLERHHLFPRDHLRSIRSAENREINQIANFTMVEWGDNANIGNRSPAEYVPILSARFDNATLERMYYWHALPDGWETMEYSVFLRERRERMANVIRDAWLTLAEHPNRDLAPSGALRVEELVASGEGTGVEFKSTLRTNLHTGQRDAKMELMVLKTIAAFINSQGGTLVIGVADDGTQVGIEADGFPDEDKMNLHLVNLLRDRVGSQFSMYIHPHFDDYQDVRVLTIDCLKGRSPVFVKDGGVERFYVRNGAATIELSASQTQAYVKSRFAV